MEPRDSPMLELHVQLASLGLGDSIFAHSPSVGVVFSVLIPCVLDVKMSLF